MTWHFKFCYCNLSFIFESMGKAEISPIQIVEEREKVECQLDPTLHLTFVESVCVHDARRVVQA